MTTCLVVFDVDSTLIDNEVIELVADHAGTREEVSRITESAMRGEIDFAQSLRHRVATLSGVPTSVFADVLTSVTVTNGAVELIEFVHSIGGKVAAVSGGFHEILDPLAEQLNLDYWRANRLDAVNGKLTGTVDGTIIDAVAKEDSLRRWASENQIDLERVFAVGDGANDLLMMKAAGTGIAFCAKPVVQEAADVVINTRDMREIIAVISNALG